MSKKIDETLDMVPINDVFEVAKKEPEGVPETDSDDEFIRDSIKNVIKTGHGALDEMLQLGASTEHPRFYEAVTEMVKALSDANRQLADINHQKETLKNKEQNPSKVNNNLFVGSTEELQKFLEKKDDV